MEEYGGFVGGKVVKILYDRVWKDFLVKMMEGVVVCDLDEWEESGN